MERREMEKCWHKVLTKAREGGMELTTSAIPAHHDLPLNLFYMGVKTV